MCATRHAMERLLISIVVCLFTTASGCSDENGDKGEPNTGLQSSGTLAHAIVGTKGTGSLVVWDLAPDVATVRLRRQGYLTVGSAQLGNTTFVAILASPDQTPVETLVLAPDGPNVRTHSAPTDCYALGDRAVRGSPGGSVAAISFHNAESLVTLKGFYPYNLAIVGEGGDYTWLGEFRITTTGGSITGFAINNDATRVVYCGSNPGLVMFDTSTREELWRINLINTDIASVQDVAFSTDCRLLFASTNNGQLLRVDAATGEILGRHRALPELTWPYRYQVGRLYSGRGATALVGQCDPTREFLVWGDDELSSVTVVERVKGFMNLHISDSGEVIVLTADGPRVVHTPERQGSQRDGDGQNE